MDAIISSLGNSKVTTVIRENNYVQGKVIKTDSFTFPVLATVEDIPTPVVVQQPQEANNQPPQSQATNTFEYTLYKSPFGLMYYILYMVDPTISLLHHTDVKPLLTKFVADVAFNLGGDKQLFKAYGFNRKRTVTLQGMQDAIHQGGFHNMVSKEILTYVSKLTKRTVTVYDVETQERYDPSETTGPIALLIYEKGKLSMVDECDDHQVLLYLLFVKEQPFPSDPKIQYLRHLAKVIGKHGSSKTELLAEISSVRDIALKYSDLQVKQSM